MTRLTVDLVIKNVTRELIEGRTHIADTRNTDNWEIIRTAFGLDCHRYATYLIRQHFGDDFFQGEIHD